MFGITSIEKLNREAAEASKILNARSPAAPAQITNEELARQIREANARVHTEINTRLNLSR